MVRKAACVLLALLTSSGLAYAEEFVGQRLKLTGRWTGAHLEVTSLQQRDPSRGPQRGLIEGRIKALDTATRTVHIGPIRVAWEDATQFRGISVEDMAPGRWIEVTGNLTEPRHLMATAIEVAPHQPNLLQIIGTVTAAEPLPDGSVRMTVLGVPAVVPKGLYTPATGLTRRLDERRPEEQLTITLFDKPLTIGGELGNTSKYRKDFELEDEAEDDLFRLEQELQLEFFYRLAANVALFLEGKVSYQADLYAEDGDRELERELARGETWLYVGNLLESGLSVQIGRQSFEETREWWWDEDLDALRLHYDRRFLHVELGIAQEVAPVSTAEDRVDPEDDDVLRLLGHVAWSWARRQRLEGFFLYQRDRSSRQSVGQLVPDDRQDPSDADLAWFGVRALGRLKFDRIGRFDYWLDSAGVVGNEVLFDFEDTDGGPQSVSERRKHNVIGWAIDLGISWQTKLPWRPTLTLAYAVGSGDGQPGEGTDRAFRQTGLQNNNGRFRGVDRFRYYGELLRPELSNLQIWTVALGFRFLQSSSVEFLYHLYWQVEPAPFLRDTRLRTDPQGERRTIGQEWDVVIGIEEWEHIEIELIGAAFRAGSAYGPLSGEMAYTVEFKVDLNF
jgi:hypothetical protein